MSYRIEVKVISTTDISQFEKECGKLESFLEVEESVAKYAVSMKVNAVEEHYPHIGITEQLLTYTAIYRIHYFGDENPVALAYGGAE